MYPARGYKKALADVLPSILNDYTYDSDLDITDGIPHSFRRSSSSRRGTLIKIECLILDRSWSQSSVRGYVIGMGLGLGESLEFSCGLKSERNVSSTFLNPRH